MQLTDPNRQQPTNADKEAYDQLAENKPSAATHPNVFAWFYLIGKFNAAIREQWAAPAAAAAKKGGKAAPAKKEEAKKAEEEEVDLFGEEEGDAEVTYLVQRY